ncbi:MAG TPA: hypothetical protein VF765_35245 [Polyangiaceae bacterium]
MKHTVLAFAAFLAMAGLAWHQMAILGDGFWTIATGRWLLAHHALPTSDPFAFASVPGPWTIVSSGACVLFAAIVRAVGERGLMVVAALVEALAVWLIWSRAARTPFARIVLLPLALFFVQVDAEDLSARGQVFGDLGIVLLFFVLAALRDSGRPKLLLPLTTLLACVWVNLHLSFVSALFLPAACGVLVALEPRASRPPLWPFFAASGVALAGACINPYGPAYLRLALGTAFDPSTQHIDLFRSPDFHDGAWLIAPALAVAVIVARGRDAEDRMRLPEQAFVLLFLVAACGSRRFATTLVAAEIAVAGPMLDRWRSARFAPPTQRATWVVAGLATLAGALWMASGNDPFRDAPVAAAKVAREAQRARAASGDAYPNVVEPLHWGGYFAYAWMGDPRYFIDGRDHLRLFGNGAFDDEATLWRGDAASLEVLDAYEAGIVVWPRGEALDRLLRADPAWQLVHADAIAVAYVRRP